MEGETSQPGGEREGRDQVEEAPKVVGSEEVLQHLQEFQGWLIWGENGEVGTKWKTRARYSLNHHNSKNVALIKSTELGR